MALLLRLLALLVFGALVALGVFALVRDRRFTALVVTVLAVAACSVWWAWLLRTGRSKTAPHNWLVVSVWCFLGPVPLALLGGPSAAAVFFFSWALILAAIPSKHLRRDSGGRPTLSAES